MSETEQQSTLMECSSTASQIRALKLTFAKHKRVKGRTFRSASALHCSNTLGSGFPYGLQWYVSAGVSFIHFRLICKSDIWLCLTITVLKESRKTKDITQR